MQGRARWLVLAAAAALAVILFLVLRPGGGDEGTTGAATPLAKTIAITVQNGKPAGGIVAATVKQGSKVTLVVHSDVADEVHVHGYDLHADVARGGTARIAFTANIAGRFEAELESRKEQILDLTVEP
jgi:hypothetical protein